jgi:transposase
VGLRIEIRQVAACEVTVILDVKETGCSTSWPLPEAWDLIGKNIAKRVRLAEIYSLAKETIGLPAFLDSATMEMFRLQLSRHLEPNALREKPNLRAQQFLADNPNSQRLMTLPGIAAVLALMIMAEAGNLHPFDDRTQFSKYCGLDVSKDLRR